LSRLVLAWLGFGFKHGHLNGCLIHCLAVSMLDANKSGTMGFNEFKQLWTALEMWKVGVLHGSGSARCPSPCHDRA